MPTVIGEALEHLDVLIVGAGISGIGGACHLREHCPEKTFAILEAREDLGGTWDLFRYPGIRSDSDMHTLGYGFKPWAKAKSIVDGPSILNYVRQAARENGVEPKIRFNRRVVAAEWSTRESRWTVTVERADTGETEQLTCGFLWMCSGYYRYDEGYTPEFPGIERFGGYIVHPQHWPEDLDYTGKRVVVIGSGATAVTLVPAMADQGAEHVTMLQRSPTYIFALPDEDRIAGSLFRCLPERIAYALVRWKNVLLSAFVFQLCRRRPEIAKRIIRRAAQPALPPGYDIDKHFTPSYNPWEQRPCAAPNGDLFRAISEGSVSVATDRIAGFTEGGIKLESGEELEADVIVTATGLNLLFLGGMRLSVDDEEVDPAGRMTYKTMMLSGVPNLAFVIGYTNASWTLKADLAAEYICRLLSHMDAHDQSRCVPELTDASVTEEPVFNLNSGYIMRSAHLLPKQGSKAPWRLRQIYALDARTLRRGPIDDGAMRFSSPAPRVEPLEKAIA
jgi:monooxygenase